MFAPEDTGSIEDISAGGSIATVAGSRAARPAEANADWGRLAIGATRATGPAWHPARAAIVRAANPVAVRR